MRISKNKGEPRRFLGDTLDSQELFDDATEKKALPELIKKAEIIMAEKNLYVARREVIEQYNNYHQVNNAVRGSLEGNLMYLFQHIRYMVEDKQINKQKDFSAIHSKLVGLLYGKKYSVHDLLAMADYLNFCLFKLNLTNLLIGGGKDVFEKFADEYS